MRMSERRRFRFRKPSSIARALTQARVEFWALPGVSRQRQAARAVADVRCGDPHLPRAVHACRRAGGRSARHERHRVARGRLGEGGADADFRLVRHRTGAERLGGRSGLRDLERRPRRPRRLRRRMRPSSAPACPKGRRSSRSACTSSTRAKRCASSTAWRGFRWAGSIFRTGGFGIPSSSPSSFW